MLSGAGDQSLTQVQQRSSPAGQEMWPCGGNEIFFLIFCYCWEIMVLIWHTKICDWHERYCFVCFEEDEKNSSLLWI